MKLLIASDIHGSAYYCEKIVKAFENEGADKLLLLGDVLYHGPRNDLPKDYDPKKVAPMLNAMKEKIIAVKGNCDSDVDQMVLEFPIMAPYAIIAFENRCIFATHGDKFNVDNPPFLNKNDVLLYGHFHVPACKVMDNFIYMNPGSTSIPKENSANSYMVTDGKHFIWKDTDGNTYMEYEL